jgi:hypothetical protein
VKVADGVGNTGGGIGSDAGSGARTTATGGACTLGRRVVVVVVGELDRDRFVLRARVDAFFARAVFFLGAGLSFFAGIPPPYFTSAASFIISV